MLPSGGGAAINCSDSSAGQVKGPVSFHCRLYFRETFPLLNDGAKSKVRSLFVVGIGSQRHIANICNRLASFLFVSAARTPRRAQRCRPGRPPPGPPAGQSAAGWAGDDIFAAICWHFLCLVICGKRLLDALQGIFLQLTVESFILRIVFPIFVGATLETDPGISAARSGQARTIGLIIA